MAKQRSRPRDRIQATNGSFAARQYLVGCDRAADTVARKPTIAGDQVGRHRISTPAGNRGTTRTRRCQTGFAKSDEIHVSRSAKWTHFTSVWTHLAPADQRASDVPKKPEFNNVEAGNWTQAERTRRPRRVSWKRASS